VADEARTLGGEARVVGSATGAAGGPAAAVAQPATLTFDDEAFSIATAGSPPIVAAYRDLERMIVQPGSVLLELGEGSGGVRVILERFGDRQARLVRELRERRTRQRLADRLVQLDADPPEMVEYRTAADHGVAELLFGPWAAELVPVDESRPPIHMRRAEIGPLGQLPAEGGLRIEPIGGADWPAVDLLGLGAAATRLQARIGGLRDGAARDAATLVGGLLADAPFGTRQRLGSLLVDGRPVSMAELGGDAGRLEGAILTEPVFAASYRALTERATGAGSPDSRWLAMAPASPGATEAKAWFFVGLPGNLVAFELVSEGAHATYVFRVVARDAYAGESPAALRDAVEGAVRSVSAALIDGRFLREPMALPADQLASARNLSYRLALAALPSLAEARRRFVARLVHDDDARWAAALDDLIRWHGAIRDEAATWPGRAAEEGAISSASADPSA
jgi:hypothetical protein